MGAAAGPATVIVKASGDVRLSVDGQPTRFTAPEQRFVTPQLEAGKSYFYEIQATVARDGKDVSVTRKVTVRAGEEARVDFGDVVGLAQQGAAPAKVTVRLPADARLYIDGSLSPLTGAVRTFETPRLEAGKPYVYELRAEVLRDGLVRRAAERITIEAGKAVEVELKVGEAQTAGR
jgi:uncharacterized protein (TIGR03000 family)